MRAPLVSQLPYNVQIKPKITKDVNTLLQIYRSLQPSAQELFSVQSGTSTLLLTLGGTVAMFFKGSQYNIPVDVYLPLTYPQTPPLVYVRPTASMALKDGHRHVDREGLVYMPYLHKWGSRSNLTEMCQGLSQIFGEDPPVYARPASQPYHPPQPPSYNSVATLQKENSYKASGTTNLEKLTVKIQGELQDFYNNARKEMQSDLALQTKLSSSQDEISKQHMNLRRIKENLESAISETKEKNTQLTQTIQKKSAELSDKSSLDPDTLINGIDPNSEKMLSLCATVAAIDDTLYYLDRALISGSINLEEMLKETRKLARKQFLAKAHIKKIVEGVGGTQDYIVR
ncbi:hypothetical protein TrLO_g4164 [Triparma laevis f. longispina]|uniref:Uncharacterized protein n=1 Tax=Triparma laevis f. longispina TaxID=1714387 RepID=A0A9W7FIG4_9STRA|nr:hypothetical protein TrLO_g4164 [Triparma laevis f. longispina]